MQNLFLLYLAVKWRYWSLFFQTNRQKVQKLIYFISKRVENSHCICEIDEGDVEFVQAKVSYDDSSSEFTESDGISDIYSADITEEEIFSESEDDLPAQTTVHQQQTIPQKKKSKQNKDPSNLQWLPEPPVYYSE